MTVPETSPGALTVFAYRTFLLCSLVCSAIALAFFAIGIADGSVSSFNMGLWLLLLAVLGAVVWAGLALRRRGRTGYAIAVLGIVAVPGLMGGLLALLVVITQPRWN